MAHLEFVNPGGLLVVPCFNFQGYVGEAIFHKHHAISRQRHLQDSPVLTQPMAAMAPFLQFSRLGEWGACLLWTFHGWKWIAAAVLFWWSVSEPLPYTMKVGIIKSSSGWWFQPIWKIWKSDGMMIFPISGKTKFMFQTNSQSSYLWAWTSTIFERTNLCHAGHTAVPCYHARCRRRASEHRTYKCSSKVWIWRRLWNWFRCPFYHKCCFLLVVSLNVSLNGISMHLLPPDLPSYRSSRSVGWARWAAPYSAAWHLEAASQRSLGTKGITYDLKYSTNDKNIPLIIGNIQFTSIH